MKCRHEQLTADLLGVCTHLNSLFLSELAAAGAAYGD